MATDKVLLIDGLYNLVPQAGRSGLYAQGVLVGMLTGLIASGAAGNCSQALQLIQDAVAGKSWVKEIPLSRIPESFRDAWKEIFGGK